MHKFLSLICAIAAQCALAQMSEEPSDYQAFTDALAKYGHYEFEPFEVIASDGAITTLFHI